MKKILIVFLVVAALLAFAVNNSTPDSTATEIGFFKGSWKQVLDKAKKENKPIFVDISASWCGPCKLLKKETFTNKEVVKYYNDNFINVALDGEVGDGAALAQKFQIPGYPTLIILDKNESPLIATVGFIPAGEFLKFGKDGLAKLKK